MRKILLLPGTDAIEHPDYRKAAYQIPVVQQQLEVTRTILDDEYQINLALDRYMIEDHKPSVESFQRLVLCSLATQVALTKHYLQSYDDKVGLLSLSLGDIARSVISGVCTFRDSVKQLYQFTLLHKMIEPGFTIQVRLCKYDKMEELLLDDYNLEISIQQNERFFLVAGSNKDILNWTQQVAMKNNIQFRILYPFPLHSSYMTPIANSMKDDIQNVCMEGHPNFTIFSTVFGRSIEQHEIMHDCLHNIDSTLQFTSTIDFIKTNHPDAEFVNIGPAPTLKQFIWKHLNDKFEIEDHFLNQTGHLPALIRA